MNTSKPIIFFGTETFSLTALTGLIEAGYSIAAVITKPDSRKGRGQQLIAPHVKIVAEKHNIPVWQPHKLADIAEEIIKLQPVAGVLVSYGKIIPQSIIDLFTPGIINIHPSLLPKYRGPSPIESAILNGDRISGVTIMQLSAAMDAGPIYTAKEYSLNGTETRPELYHALANFGANLVLEALPRILDNELMPQPQDDLSASYCQLLQKSNARLDTEKLTAIEAERHIRAYLDFPKTKISLMNQDVILTKAHTSLEKKSPLDIKCRDGVFLCIDELIAPSGRKMSASAFLNGYAA